MADLAIYPHNQQGDHAPIALEPAKAHQALAQAEAICQAHGAKLTPIRRQVLQALHASPRPLGAYDLADVLAPTGRRLAPITIYRALDFLIEQGLVHRLASQNSFIASFSGSSSRDATIFLICEECDGVSEASSPELGEALNGLLKGQGFQSRAKVLEIMGRCAHCREIH